MAEWVIERTARRGRLMSLLAKISALLRWGNVPRNSATAAPGISGTARA